MEDKSRAKLDAFEKELSRTEAEKKEALKLLEQEKDSLLQKCKDLEDEIIEKNLDVDILRETVEKKNNEKSIHSTVSSLADELEFAHTIMPESENEKRIKELEFKQNQAEKNKEKKKELLEKLEKLSVSRDQDLENLKEKIKNFKDINNHERERCNYGWKCRRLFCNYDHGYLFRKNNISVKISSNSSNINVKRDTCNLCNSIFKTSDDLKHHMKEMHQEIQCEKVKLKQILNQCEKCLQMFSKNSEFKKHRSKCTKGTIFCDNCARYFLSCKELLNHKKTDHADNVLAKPISKAENENGEVSVIFSHASLSGEVSRI